MRANPETVDAMHWMIALAETAQMRTATRLCSTDPAWNDCMEAPHGTCRGVRVLQATCMTLASMSRFCWARSRMACSMVPALTRTSTRTSRFCPMRCALSSA